MFLKFCSVLYIASPSLCFFFFCLLCQRRVLCCVFLTSSRPCIYLSIYLLFLCLSSTYLSCMYIRTYVSVYLCLSVCLSIHPSVHPSTYPPTDVPELWVCLWGGWSSHHERLNVLGPVISSGDRSTSVGGDFLFPRACCLSPEDCVMICPGVCVGGLDAQLFRVQTAISPAPALHPAPLACTSYTHFLPCVPIPMLQKVRTWAPSRRSVSSCCPGVRWWVWLSPGFGACGPVGVSRISQPLQAELGPRQHPLQVLRCVALPPTPRRPTPHAACLSNVS